MWSRVNLRKVITMPAFVIGAWVLAFSFHPAYGQVSIPNRPFAVNPGTMDQLFDGIFDMALDDQLIGVFLKNDSASTIRNVQATASFDAGSGIALTSNVATFGDLPPGVPVLGFFRASFRGSTPSKQLLTLNLSGDSFSQGVSRNIFVWRSEPGPGDNAYTVYAPEGRAVFQINGFYGGTNLGSLTAPTAFKQTVFHNTPFPGQFSLIPFNDPWWKVVGIGGMAVGGGVMVVGGIGSLCGARWGNGVAWIGAGVGSIGGAAAMADLIDPFRRGQQNTIPGAGEPTQREEVVATVQYLQEPLVGTPYSANVSWTYTRFTNVTSYSYSVNEVVQNDIHYTTNRNVTFTTQGDTLVVTASANGPGGPLTNNQALFFGKIYAAADDHLMNILGTFVLRDDGHQGDAVAGDGIYTARVPTASLPANPSIYILGYDINNAAASDPPLIAAQKIGGALISTPSFSSMDSPFNVAVPEQCTIQSDMRAVSSDTKERKLDSTGK